MPGYLSQLRQLVGSRKLIHPAARILLENKEGEILLIQRKDNGNWGLIAGGLEEGESISECIKREVLEETGLKVQSLELIGVSSDPDQETVQYPNGDLVQYLTLVFYSRDWQGEILEETEETQDARFFALDQLPKLPPNEQPSIDWLRRYKETGKVMVE